MARFTGGWVKFYRKTLSGDIGDDGITLAVWVTLLGWACWEPGKRKFQAEQILLEPGMLITGSRDIAKKLNFSKSTVHRALRYLQKTGRIFIKSGTRGSLITICNWKEYQAQEEQAGTRMGHRWDTDGTQMGHEPNHSKEVQEVKNLRTNTNAVNENVNLELELVNPNPQRKVRKSRVKTDSTPEFDELWFSYKAKGDKKKAWTVFKSLNLSEDEKAQLKKSISRKLAATKDHTFLKDFERFLLTDWINADYATQSAPELTPRKMEDLA